MRAITCASTDSDLVTDVYHLSDWRSLPYPPPTTWSALETEPDPASGPALF